MAIFIIFQQLATGQCYCWNGEYPINLSGDQGITWDPRGDIEPTEVRFFKELETNKKRTFTLPNRGKYEVLSRTKSIEV